MGPIVPLVQRPPDVDHLFQQQVNVWTNLLIIRLTVKNIVLHYTYEQFSALYFGSAAELRLDHSADIMLGLWPIMRQN